MYPYLLGGVTWNILRLIRTASKQPEQIMIEPLFSGAHKTYCKVYVCLVSRNSFGASHLLQSEGTLQSTGALNSAFSETLVKLAKVSSTDPDKKRF